ncbi:MAG: sensor histidine kinase [Deltaproteobacteria bacterium]|nr:sensor histidine kinase [Deltaproteobacteria bacterium]MBW2067985.1 sensor histidine kinase [Deltaproteobacteria bacterium]
MGHLTLREVIDRVEEKKQDYQRYNFERLQEEAFATFFDLAQESTALDHLFLIAVAVPKVFFDLDSVLYVVNPRNKKLEKVCTSSEGLVEDREERSKVIELRDKPFQSDYGWAFPIRGNQALTQWMPYSGINGILGLFEVLSSSELREEDIFFLQKFANRIGYNLHQKLLIQQNLEHLKFINQLVADIEHNVISPNLYYKLYLRRMKKLSGAYRDLQKRIRDLIIFSQEQMQNIQIAREICEIYHQLATNNDRLEEETQALEKHYTHTSLFLETLLRRDHFVHGTYVLKKQPCNFKEEIIEPLLDRYEPILAKRGIKINKTLDNLTDREITLLVDKGLISQVFDNLFSNALKYTEEIEDPLGNKVKLMSYDSQILKNYFGEGLHGVKFSIFTTGKPLPEEEAKKVFEEGYRADNAKSRTAGSGHGLNFVKNVVEIHGGHVGCEPEQYGNSFYFVLPMKEEKTYDH